MTAVQNAYPANGSQSNGVSRSPLRAHLRSALALLSEGYEYAIELDRDVWHFALELDALREARVSDSDLHWLFAQGYVDHAWEITGARDYQRTFQDTDSLAFGDRSCFVCTTSGMKIAA